MKKKRFLSPSVRHDLAKLCTDPDSRRDAWRSLRGYVECLSPGGLYRFLSQLSESRDCQPYAIRLYEYVAHIHGKAIISHVPQLMEALTRALLESGSAPHLQQDCANVVVSIAKNVIDSSLNIITIEQIFRNLCDPLMDILLSKLEPLSTGGATCLKSLVECENWKFAPASLISRLCLRATVVLCERPSQTVAHMQLIRSLAVVNASALGNYGIPLLRVGVEVLHRCTTVDLWQQRTAAAQLLQSVLIAADYSTLSSELKPTVDALSKHRHDRMLCVRKAVIEALKTAKALLSHHSEEPRSLVASSGQFWQPISRSSTARNLSKGTPVCSRYIYCFDDVTAKPLYPKISEATPASPDILPSSETSEKDGYGSDYFCAYFSEAKENIPTNIFQDCERRTGTILKENISEDCLQRMKTSPVCMSNSDGAQQKKSFPLCANLQSDGKINFSIEQVSDSNYENMYVNTRRDVICEAFSTPCNLKESNREFLKEYEKSPEKDPDQTTSYRTDLDRGIPVNENGSEGSQHSNHSGDETTRSICNPRNSAEARFVNDKKEVKISVQEIRGNGPTPVVHTYEGEEDGNMEIIVKQSCTALHERIGMNYAENILKSNSEPDQNNGTTETYINSGDYKLSSNCIDVGPASPNLSDILVHLANFDEELSKRANLLVPSLKLSVLSKHAEQAKLDFESSTSGESTVENNIIPEDELVADTLELVSDSSPSEDHGAMSLRHEAISCLEETRPIEANTYPLSVATIQALIASDNQRRLSETDYQSVNSAGSVASSEEVEQNTYSVTSSNEDEQDMDNTRSVAFMDNTIADVLSKSTKERLLERRGLDHQECRQICNDNAYRLFFKLWPKKVYSFVYDLFSCRESRLYSSILFLILILPIALVIVKHFTLLYGDQNHFLVPT